MNSNLPALRQKDDGFIIDPDNPYKDTFEQFMNRIRTTSKSYDTENVQITVNVTKNTLPGGWIRVYQNDIITKLSPAASKAFLFIACNMDWNTQKVKLDLRLMDMNPKTASNAVVELLFENIIKKEKRGIYWVNLTLLVIGNPKLNTK